MSDDVISATVENVVTRGRPIDFRVFDLTSERDAMTTDDLKAGVFVFVNETQKLFQRNAGNTAWIDYGASVTPSALASYILAASKGVANGVATLGADSKIPSSQIDTATFEVVNRKGEANGYAALDGDGKVPLAQLPDDIGGGGGNTGLDPSVRDLFVDTENGDDANDGLAPETPLLTIQAAVWLFLPPSAGAPLWDTGDDRRINVKHTPGMAPIELPVDIPTHRGGGFLVIDAEMETVVSGLVMSGSVGAIADFENKKRITLSTSPLSAHAHAFNGFLVLRDLESLEPYTYQRGWEDLPIIDNAAGTIDVVAVEPGVFSAIHYQDGVVMDIVRPQIVWSAAPTTDPLQFSPSFLAVNNHGGGLIIRGFDLKAPSDESNLLARSFIKTDEATDSFVANNAQLNRCRSTKSTTGQYWENLVQGNVDIAGFIVGVDSMIYLTHAMAATVNLYNVAMNASGALSVVALLLGTQAVNAYGLVISRTSGSPYVLQVGSGFQWIDARGVSVCVFDGVAAAFTALTIENVGVTTALQLGATRAGSGLGAVASFGDPTRIKGSTGNAGVGCHIGLLSQLSSLLGNPLLEGASGQLQVGDLEPDTWANQAAGVSDPTKFARYN